MDSVQGTPDISQFDLNGHDAQVVVKRIMRRVSAGFNVKLSKDNAKILAQILYAQALTIQSLQDKLSRAAALPVLPPKLDKRRKLWFPRGS